MVQELISKKFGINRMVVLFETGLLEKVPDMLKDIMDQQAEEQESDVSSENPDEKVEREKAAKIGGLFDTPDAANPNQPMLKVPQGVKKNEKFKKPLNLNKKKELNKMELRHAVDNKIEQWVLENENLKVNAIAKVKMI